MKEKVAIHRADCLQWLEQAAADIDLTFLDPPFNQGRFYRHFDDRQDEKTYWKWMTDILALLRGKTCAGGAVYFMQREKNAEFVLTALRKTGWTFQNLIIWKKMASAVPCANRFGKHYQVIAAATNGPRAKIFHRLRIDPPLPPNHKQRRENGVFVTDVWDDIRELTSGYYAGGEPIRTDEGERFHKQQAPVALLARIILSSSNPGDTVFDPFAGTGTTLVAASQLNRNAVGVEIDPANIECIKNRVAHVRPDDSVKKHYHYYRHTQGIEKIWGAPAREFKQTTPSNAPAARADIADWRNRSDSVRIPSV
ncbi:MAG: site-specific DNA-methyltransferase [Gammaproteobacteria bacterium]|nr:site-specific DNA-methyltransferase [Gammaproteobacteria bacterium]